MQLYTNTSEACSTIVTKQYSTSFAGAIKLLHKSLRQPIFNIYGFVRIADEIVDTFHNQNKEKLLTQFEADTYEAIANKFSLNPILHSFQATVNEYQIEHHLIQSFFISMYSDLKKQSYNKVDYETYIYGSAQVVGLMCLQVFCAGNITKFNSLEPYAKALGSAFQKVNFLRDIKADYIGLHRMYFPYCDFNNFNSTDKKYIELDIKKDFEKAYIGIKQLPLSSRLGVYVAYKYYLSLFNKITKLQPNKILESRIRIANYRKMIIIFKAGLQHQFNTL